MATINQLYGTIATKNGPLYIKEYYANKYVVRFTLTNNPDEQISFSGEKLSGDCYGGPANYKPLLSVRDALRSEEMKYLKYKSISVFIRDFNGDFIRLHRLGASHNAKYHGIAGKLIEVNDLVNNVKVSFKK